MPSIIVNSVSGESRRVDAAEDQSLMEALRQAGYEEIEAICGGSCSCATCHVHILPHGSINLFEPELDEQELLELSDQYQAKISRLSCQIELTSDMDGLEVQILAPE